MNWRFHTRSVLGVSWCFGARNRGLHYSWVRIGDWIIRLERLSHPAVKHAVGPWCLHTPADGVKGGGNA